MLNHSRRELLLASLGATALAGRSHAQTPPAAGPGAADGYPSRPIRIIVGFLPGGATDIVARAVAQPLQESLGQPVLVDNRPGGGSNIAAEWVARAEPDGYTLLQGTVANATNMSIYRNLKYDTQRDLAPISQLMSAPSVLVVTPSLPVNSVSDLVALARMKPETLTYASSGAGGSPHLASAMLELRAGIRMIHVPYKGAAQAHADVVSGTVNLGFMTALSALPSMQSGKLKPLAVAAAHRLKLLPDLPTMAESGFPDFEVSSWNGLFAPAKTPPAVINRLYHELTLIVHRPDFRARLDAQAAEPVGSTPEQFRAYVGSEIRRWGEVARRAAIVLN